MFTQNTHTVLYIYFTTPFFCESDIQKIDTVCHTQPRKEYRKKSERIAINGDNSNNIETEQYIFNKKKKR